MKDKLTVIKVGGGIIYDPIILDKFLVSFSKIKGYKLLVHGGGNITSNYLSRLGIQTEIVDGRRITNESTLDVAIMTYAGLINKTIVCKLQKYKCNSIGLSGVDCNLIKAVKRPINKIDYGLVGDITEINDVFLNTLLKSKVTPVICSLSHDGNGQIFNTNADTIASFLSIKLTKDFNVTLKYCFDKSGVLNDRNSLIKTINLSNYKNLINEKIISGGMIPKIENCFSALKQGVSNIFIGGNNVINNENYCTKLTLE
jgi:acetylglutamate kinase|tara:strand:- start:3152 stop:3922 length:771 start_codon:yes stop_codon:yes gene_type:complete